MTKHHFNENMEIIDTESLEKTEQDLADKFISYNDIVLEIGGRYGTVSTIINKKLKLKKNHFLVEPDQSVLKAIEINKKNHGCEFKIETGVISDKKQTLVQDGYGTRLINDNDPNEDNVQVNYMTYRELKNKYKLTFNTLVVDCEGCFLNVLESIGDDISEIEKIILEKDQPDLCDYKKIEDILKFNNFCKVIDGFHSVYTRNCNNNLHLLSIFIGFIILFLVILIFTKCNL